MGKTNQPSDLLALIKDLQRQVNELRRGQTLNNATLSNGALDVRTPDGHVIFRAGAFSLGGTTVWGVAGYRYDGTVQFWSYDTPSGGGFTSLWDEANNIVVSTDTVSGHGLATPYIPIPFYSAATANPTDTTTSGTFADMQYARYKMQHPRLSVNVLCRASDGTTSGEVQVTVGGTVWAGGPQTVGLGAYTYKQFGPAALPGAYTHTGAVDIVVQARRTAGAGTIGVRVVSAYGEQS